ncbi:GspH/FimT family pseudopilin [Psychrobacter proteolyticus]|uniref:GspH/FimT family pseudopilin n=1 Tax=Psychrobacter proteolyticus TaxID=147825 RepID=UPI001D101102|nr:GspH/FimT family pseudopilin [Psychrobacter proteolyticus]
MILFYKILSRYKLATACVFSIFIYMKRKCTLDSLPISRIHSLNILFKSFKYSEASCENIDNFNVKHLKGFTLVELIVTILVIGIIVAIATPSILTQLARMEAKRVKQQLEDALSLAQAESYISRKNVLVCLSNNARQCHRNSDKMLLLFVDKNGNNRFDPQVDNLLTQQILNLKYSTVKLRVGGKRHYIKFWGDSGKPRGHFGHIKYCPTSSYNKSMYQISFNQSGIVRHKRNIDHPTKCNS